MYPQTFGRNVVLRPDELRVSHVEMRRNVFERSKVLQYDHPRFLRASERDAGILDTLQSLSEGSHGRFLLRQGVVIAERSSPLADVIMAVCALNKVVSLACGKLSHCLKNLFAHVRDGHAVLPW